MSTSTFTQCPSSDSSPYFFFSIALRPQRPQGRGALVGHLDFHTVPELWYQSMYYMGNYMTYPLQTKSGPKRRKTLSQTFLFVFSCACGLKRFPGQWSPFAPLTLRWTIGALWLTTGAASFNRLIGYMAAGFKTASCKSQLKLLLWGI